VLPQISTDSQPSVAFQFISSTTTAIRESCNVHVPTLLNFFLRECVDSFKIKRIHARMTGCVAQTSDSLKIVLHCMTCIL
jgi:hypothetical protein